MWLGLAAGAQQANLLQEMGPWLASLAALAGGAAVLGRGDGRLVVTALAVGAAVLGIWRAFSLGPAENPLEGRSGFVTVRGTISSRPEPRDTALLLKLDVEELGGRASRESMRARVLLRTDRYGDWAYGDRVAATGQLQPVDPGSGYWAESLARQGIFATLEYPRMTLEDRPPGLDVQRVVDVVRGQLERVCAALFPEPQASLLAGILVGGRASMPADFRDALNATSTSHIVAVSGFNVTVVAGMVLFAALRFLARRKATLLAIAAVWAYSVLTGLPPSALRAAIMATMALSAVLAGRGGDTLSFLCLAAAVMAGLDPTVLSDLGYQLSFLATAGLVLLEPALRGWLGRLPGWLATSLSVTLAAQLATMPVLVGNFHTLSLVSPVTNLLIAPVLPALMGFGALAALLGWALQPLGQLFAAPAWLLLTYVVEVIRWTARLPGASAPTGSLEPAAVGAYLTLLAGLALWPMAEVRRARDAVVAAIGRTPRWAMAGALAGLFGLAALTLSARPDGRVHVYFLDVGHGDATLIRSAEGYQLLVDGGPSPTAITGALGRRVPFLDRGLDAVILTGYGEDRLAGLIEVARRHAIGLVIQPATPEAGPAGRTWKELVRERGLKVVRAAAGQEIALGPDARLRVLWAPAEGDEEEDAALLVSLAVGGVNVLLPGDLSRGTQVEIARASAGRAEVLRVPQHGAAGALDERFLQMLAPRTAVVSTQGGNRFGHPAESTLNLMRGATLFRTDRDGTVEVSIGREGYEVFTER